MSGETLAHTRLKRLAMTHLRQRGCLILAAEVRCPQSKYRVDVAGYLDRMPTTTPEIWTRCPPRSIVIECKQSRADFLRDTRRTERLLDMRDRLEHIRRSIEQHRITAAEPQLRRSGTALFREMEEWDFASSRLPAYRRVLNRLRRVHEQLHGETKFFLMARYILADELYIAAPRGLIRPRELPNGWGLLECPLSLLRRHARTHAFDSHVEMAVRVPAPQRNTRDLTRTRWLRNIAVAACSEWSKAHAAKASIEIKQLALPFAVDVSLTSSR